VKDFTELYRRIMPRARGAARPVVDQAIREAAAEFCKRTRLWRGEDEFIISEIGEEVVAVPTEAALYEIESARFNGDTLTPISLSRLEETVPRWRELESHAVQWITQTAPDSVRLVPAAKGTLSLSLTLCPAVSTERLPDFLIDHYADALTDGALADLFMMPAEYGNPGMAQYHEARFNRALDRLATANMKGQQRAAVRTTPQFF